MLMSEIKAYIRPAVVDPVIHGLESIGVKAMTITAVEAIGALADKSESRLSLTFVEKYSKVYKIEIVTCQEDEDQIVSLIQRVAHTGESGDGVVFVSPVHRAVKIRTGEEGHFTLDRTKGPDPFGSEASGEQ